MVSSSFEWLPSIRSNIAMSRVDSVPSWSLSSAKQLHDQGILPNSVQTLGQVLGEVVQIEASFDLLAKSFEELVSKLAPVLMPELPNSAVFGEELRPQCPLAARLHVIMNQICDLRRHVEQVSSRLEI